MPFYLGLGMQLIGFAMVGICLFAGLSSGGYGKLQLFQFLFGSALFYVGTFFKNRPS